MGNEGVLVQVVELQLGSPLLVVERLFLKALQEHKLFDEMPKRTFVDKRRRMKREM